MGLAGHDPEQLTSPAWECFWHCFVAVGVGGNVWRVWGLLALTVVDPEQLPSPAWQCLWHCSIAVGVGEGVNGV